MNPDFARGIVLWIFLAIVFYCVGYFYLVPLLNLSLNHPFLWGFIALNLSTFGIVFVDKIYAHWQTRRVPKVVLYTATLLGGSIGMLLGMYAFRHKTKKASFQLVVALLILIQFILLLKLSSWFNVQFSMYN